MNTHILGEQKLQRPTVSLPVSFAALSDVAQNLPILTQSGAATLRSEVRKIPLFDTTTGLSDGETRLALLYYHMIQSAYIHIEEGESVIPKNIAIPSYHLSMKLSAWGYTKPPVLGYFSYIPDNYKVKDEDTPFVLENLEPLVTFTGTESEKYFILTHLMPFEYKGVIGLNAVLKMREALKNRDHVLIMKSLEELIFCFSEIQDGFTQIEQKVLPDVYRTDIRRYLISLTNVTYEGVDAYKEPQSFTGASGAQTVTIPAFSLALGIRYKNHRIIESLANTKKYLHPKDQAFISCIENGPNLWEYVKNNKNDSLVYVYNTCLEALNTFRVSHAKFIASYIAPSGADPRGTGNMVIPWWLEEIIKETRDYYIL